MFESRNRAGSGVPVSIAWCPRFTSFLWTLTWDHHASTSATTIQVAGPNEWLAVVARPLRQLAVKVPLHCLLR